MNSLAERLKELREAGRRVCEKILRERGDVVAVLVVGSVARGDIHEGSDVDLCVLVESGYAVREELIEGGCVVDVSYAPLNLWMERLRRDVGSMWEINVSNILDSIVLYDPRGLVDRIKRELSRYPEEKRRENFLHHFYMMGWHENSVKHYYARGSYDFAAIFSKLFALESLRALFPLNGVYLRGDKYIFDQIGSLRAPPGFIEGCMSLLWFKARGVTREEAGWIMSTISTLRRAIEAEARSLGLLPAPHQLGQPR